MIAVLRGHLLEKHPSRLIVDVHGVGYDVQVPVSTFYQAVIDRKSTRLNSSHMSESRMPSSA